jgi:uncharacterized membrane protein
VIDHPAGLLLVLLLVEGGVLRLARNRALERLFKVLPPLFWIYFLPTVIASLGVIPGSSPLYDALVKYALPGSLVLLFLTVDLPAILRLGPLALSCMAVSTLGILAGGPAVLLLFGRWLPGDAWAGLGALSASWMGGSANMVAVKASIGTPEQVFSQVVIVDVVVAYSWLAVVMALASQQQRFNRWCRARTDVLERLARSAASSANERRAGSGVSPSGSSGSHRLTPVGGVLMVPLAAAGAAVATLVGRALPVVEGVITHYTWVVVVVTAVGIVLSFTPARRLERHGAPRLGFFLLYLVLTSIGAQADLTALARAPLFVLAGALWMAIHALILLAGGRLLRAPLFLLATASQANVGGPVSAPMVAEAYQPGLAGVGLLLAVLGNVCGTYLGILCSLICRALAAA